MTGSTVPTTSVTSFNAHLPPENVTELTFGVKTGARPSVESATFGVGTQGRPGGVGALGASTTVTGSNNAPAPVQDNARRAEAARRRATIEQENPYKDLAASRTIFWGGRNYHLIIRDTGGSVIAFSSQAWDAIERVFIQNLDIIKQNNPNAINEQELMDITFDTKKNQVVFRTGSNLDLNVHRSPEMSLRIVAMQDTIRDAGNLPGIDGSPSSMPLHYEAGKQPPMGLHMENTGSMRGTNETLRVGDRLSSSDLSNYLQILAQTHKQKRKVRNPFKAKPPAPYQLIYSNPLDFNDSFKKIKKHFFDVIQEQLAELEELREEDRKKHLCCLPIQANGTFSAVILDLKTNTVFYFSPSQAEIDPEIEEQLTHLLQELNRANTPWNRVNVLGNHPVDESGFQVLDAIETLLDQPVSINNKNKALQVCLEECSRITQDESITREKYRRKAELIKDFDPSVLEPAKEKFWHKIPLLNRFANP